MERIFEALRPFIRGVARRPWPVLVIGLSLAAVGGYYATGLRIDTDFAKLIPEHYESVKALHRLRDNVGGESEVAVAIESPSFEANRRFAEDLIPKAMALTGKRSQEPYFTRVLYRREISFLQDNALYFATDGELDSLERYLEDQIEQARLEANPFYFELEDEDEAVDSTAIKLREAYDALVGKEYPISDDSLTLALRFYPSKAQTNLGFIRDVYRDLERLVEDMDPASYHPDMEVTLAGRLLRQLVEVDTITKDVQESFGAGVLTLLLMVVAYFLYKSYQARVGRRFAPRVLLSELARAPVNALILGGPLVVSLAWTFGLVHFVYGTLNVMTSTLGLVLFGLGIDFGIHFFARYAEERGAGHPVVDAVERTFMTTGQAVAVVAITTAAAFYVLMLADFRGFSEFGFIAGTGILFALVAMSLLLPALVAFFEHLGLLNLTAMPVGVREDGSAPGRLLPGGRFPAPRRFIAVGAAAVVLAIAVLPRVAFEYDFGSLDPEYEEYNAKNSKARRVYSDRRTRNAAYVVVDDPEEAPAVAAALRAYAEADTVSPTIRAVETLQDRFPATPARQQAKLERLAGIRTLLDDAFLDASDDPDLARLRRAAATTEPIPLDEVPDFIKEPFTSKRGTVGHLVVIYPSVGLSDGRQSMAFSDDVGTIVAADGRVYHAGSTSLVAADMLRLMQREAPLMVGLTVLLIVVFKLIILRRIMWTALALLPLAAAFLWMFGIMELVGWKLNFYNLVVLPTVLGIGDDSGIHIVHRYLEEGRGSIRRVLRSTGEHITMSAFTTMVGFGGLLVSIYPGMRSIGELAVLGIGMTLVAALFFLPALLQWLEDRHPEAEAPQAAPPSLEPAQP